uniref:Uncharacterized protein n=1 Tax=Romanomermis culicivorax TaxID=13658 RepID=A0A915JWX7_ROMCU
MEPNEHYLSRKAKKSILMLELICRALMRYGDNEEFDDDGALNARKSLFVIQFVLLKIMENSTIFSPNETQVKVADSAKIFHGPEITILLLIFSLFINLAFIWYVVLPIRHPKKTGYEHLP